MKVLPTGVFGQWTVTDFLGSLLDALRRDKKAEELRLCFYGATLGGWDQVRAGIGAWRKRRSAKAIAVVGTDHGLTDPDCLDEMLSDGIELHLMVDYAGLYHPKMAWLTGGGEDSVWIGSNNLTENGLLHNIELASLIQFKGPEQGLVKWYEAVLAGASRATPELLTNYRDERDDYGKALATLGSFTWSRRSRRRAVAKRSPARGASRSAALGTSKGDLVIEIMRHETGTDGKQVQLPKAVATRFFGLPDRVGSSLSILLSNVPSGYPRTLTMRLFENHTTRLSLRELEYRHRPCVCIFHKTKAGYEYEIVPRAIYPERYQELVDACGEPTRRGSRRFGIRD